MHFEWLKNKKKERFYPMAHAEGILYGNDCKTTVSVEIENIKHNYLPKTEHLPLYNKTVCFIGDSRTWYDGNNYVGTAKDEIVGTLCKGYQQTVKKYTGCNIVTLGYNGGNSAYIASQVKNYDFSQVDYVVLDGGVNDYIVGGVEPGELMPIDKVFSIENNNVNIEYTVLENRIVTTDGMVEPNGCAYATAAVKPNSIIYLGRESENYSVAKDAIMLVKEDGSIRTIALTELDTVTDYDGLKMKRIDVNEGETLIKFNVKLDTYDETDTTRLKYRIGDEPQVPDTLSIYNITNGKYCTYDNFFDDNINSIIGTVNVDNINTVYIRRESENYSVKNDCVVISDLSGNKAAMLLSSTRKVTDADGHIWMVIDIPETSTTLTFTIKLSNLYDDTDKVYVRTNIPGLVSNLNTSTAYGAWQSMIEHIFKTNPNAKIIMNTIFPCWDENGAIPEIHSDIKRNVAKEYNLPICDLEKLSGINMRNRDEFYCDDLKKTPLWHLHLNNKGNEKIGYIIANFINNI